jgi:hypothetical protein
MPAVHLVTDGEQAHNIAIRLAKYGLCPKSHTFEDQSILVAYRINHIQRRDKISKNNIIISIDSYLFMFNWIDILKLLQFPLRGRKF